nr:cytosine C5 specific DNA methyltransferase [Sicyoidochytrium minutum DNA virus]
MEDNRVAIDLFGGCGGAGYGYTKAGYKVCLAYEINAQACETYTLNYGDHTSVQNLDLDSAGALTKIKRDVSKFVKPNEQLEAVFASPPCTDFSMAGNREEGEAAALSIRTADIIKALGPRTFVIENVPELLNSETYYTMKERLMKMYDIASVKINAARVRVPQGRVRVFVIGIRTDLNPPGRFTLERLIENIAENQEAKMMTFRDAMPWFPNKYYYICPRGKHKRGIYTIDLPAPTLRTNCSNKLNVQTYEERGCDAGPARDAVDLTVQQLAALMTFPSFFNFPEGLSRTTCGRLIGNAVPCNLAQYIGTRLLEIMSWLNSRPTRPGVYLHAAVSNNERGKGTVTDARIRRIIRFTNESSLTGMQEACKVHGASLTQIKGSSRLELGYQIGTTEHGDLQMFGVIKCELPPGWTVKIKERPALGTDGSAPDDIFFYPPDQKIPIRSLKQVKSKLEHDRSEFQRKFKEERAKLMSTRLESA